MANEHSGQKPNEQKLSDISGQKPAVSVEDAAKRARQDELTALWGVGKPTGNLTRDSIVETARGKHIAAGKTPEEAHKLALELGFTMIP